MKTYHLEWEGFDATGKPVEWDPWHTKAICEEEARRALIHVAVTRGCRVLKIRLISAEVSGA